MSFSVNFRKISSFFLIVFSGFYLTRITSVSPVYFSFIFGVLLLIINYLKDTRYKINKYSIAILLYILYLSSSQLFLDPQSSSFINVVFSLLYFVIVLNVCKRVSTSAIVRSSYSFVIFSIVLLSIEAFWRISHPVFIIEGTGQDYRELEGMMFYAFKYSSIMFEDSNYVGTYGLITFFYYYFLLKKSLVKNWVPLLLLVFLIFLTLSRSAIVSIPLSIFCISILKGEIRFKYKILLFTLGGFFVSAFVSVIALDQSFLSKFKIFNLTFAYLSSAGVKDILFGVGFGNTVKLIGIGAHNLFITHFIESGIIGLLFFLYVNLVFVKVTNRLSLYVTIPLFISGMSLTGHAISYYYSCLALIYILRTNEK